MSRDIAQLLKHLDTKQRSRWLDSIGIINLPTMHSLLKISPKVDTWGWVVITRWDQSLINDYMEGVREWVQKNDLQWPFILHHRKASIGAIDLENAHPFKMKWFYLMQNGTSHEFAARAKIEALFDDKFIGRSDTYALAKCVERHRENREEIVKRAGWVVVIVNPKDKHVEIYGDGERAFEVDESSGGFHCSVKAHVERKFKGKCILDFDLNPIRDLCEYEVARSSTYTPTVTTPINGARVHRSSSSPSYSPHSRFFENTTKFNASQLASWVRRTHTSKGTYLFSMQEISDKYMAGRKFKTYMNMVPPADLFAALKKDHSVFWNLFGRDIEDMKLTKSSIYSIYKQFLQIMAIDSYEQQKIKTPVNS